MKGKHFGINCKLGFETQFIKKFLPSFHLWLCKEFGVFRFEVIWIGLTFSFEIWLGEA